MKHRPRVQLHKHTAAIAVVAVLLGLCLLTLPASASPFQISNVSAGEIGNTTATITWTTDELGNSTVNYGNTIPLDNSLSNSTFVTSHIISLTDLAPATLYYYEVASTNEAGNVTLVDNNGGLYYTFTTDPYFPTISGINVGNITDTSAIITWTTDRLANSTVNYGNSTPPSIPASESDFVLNHSVTLTGLTPSTQYYYEVSSTNQYGNSTVDNNSGSFYTFTTSLAPPTISEVSAGNMTDTSVTITWKTDELANSVVNYGNSTSLGSTVSDAGISYNHMINLTGLNPNTLYYYEVSSTNTDGQTAVSPGNCS
jgi:phosphodiesterase/alkaline phosphatase D-like protein